MAAGLEGRDLAENAYLDVLGVLPIWPLLVDQAGASRRTLAAVRVLARCARCGPVLARSEQDAEVEQGHLVLAGTPDPAGGLGPAPTKNQASIASSCLKEWRL